VILPGARLRQRGLRSLDRLDATLVVAAAALALGTIVLLGVLDLHVQFSAPGLDVAIDTATTVVTGVVAALALVRYQERGQPIAIYQAAAFLVFFIANGYALSLVLGQTDSVTRVAEIAASQATPWVYASSRLLTAGLLVAGGLTTLWGARVRHSRALFVGAGMTMLALILVAVAARDVLPPLSTPFTVQLTDDVVGAGADLPMSTALGSLLQLTAAVGFVWASFLTRGVFRRDRSIGDAYLAVGLLFAASAQLHVAFYPGVYPGIVTSGDFLRLTFDVVLLLGIYQEARQSFIDVRGANEGLVRLSKAEAEAAGLEERARLARELHDGLAQSLWLAKLYVGRLGAVHDLGDEAITVTDALRGVVDTALAEAREAVMALRSGSDDPDRSLKDLLQRSADDFSDRFGVRVECSFADPFPALGSRVDAELLRITREAFTNIGKHSDATVARLAATVEDHTLTLRIRDNGRGFDPADIEEGRVGIKGMRERAVLIDARLAIESERSGGTTVTIDVGLPARVAEAGST